ncbi:hypothetical protein [Sunxiuqinia dokdonensis]|uniref:SNARE associated Golgi protein n=1 Tax=Sunxiuqinia dokdonensis TaxID=1409788 RepID=A0A0L8VED3_9BACT|nr:hypothetical protein [Sunxiuqinia dokdonensis]KOH46698.1 hypothetical protein NC99_05380 [Sunxiuqinia dokdonensis]
MDLFGVVKLIHVFLLAMVKYSVTFPYALLIGLDATQAILVVTIGGISGFFFFYYLSAALLRLLKRRHIKIVGFFNTRFNIDLSRLSQKWKPNFSGSMKKRRLFVRFRNRYGFIGIIIATPVLLSIPIGAFLLNRYYSRRKHVFAYMVLSILGWSLLFSAIVII